MVVLWFTAIFLITNSKNKVTARSLAQLIEVNKNTAATMISRIRDAQINQSKLFIQIIRDRKIFWLRTPDNNHKVRRDGENGKPQG